MENGVLRIYNCLYKYYDLEEIQTLCFEVGINYDDLRGTTLGSKSRELVLQARRRRKLGRLLAAIHDGRPEAFEQAGLSLDPAEVEKLYGDSDIGRESDPVRVSVVWFACCAVGAALLGGLFWNLLCDLLQWQYFTGGSGHEPQGVAAFMWGFTSFLPVIVLACLACYRLVPSTRWLPVIYGMLLYPTLGGLAAVAFYGSGLRHYVEGLGIGYGSQELLIVLVWSLALSISTYIGLLALRGLSEVVSLKHLLLQIPVAVALAVGAVLMTLVISRPTEAVEILRGIGAGIALRLGLFLGLVLAFYIRPFQRKQLELAV